MGSQFVDLNGDGHLDYLSATFDGSPHIAWGVAKGFGEPERLRDVNGHRLRISSIWNYESRAHENLWQPDPAAAAIRERCISALAFDWDGDGDLDLLLGSYENGHLYRQMNDGSKTTPRFTGTNIPVMAGDAPFALPAKMTAPQLVDWDGDGDLDLVTGSFGDSYGSSTGGGVYLARNQGKPGAPAFDALVTLIEPSRKGAAEPTRPDAGLYPHAVDYDGDGDLDLVVGGYSMWTPVARPLTSDEQAQADQLQTTLAALRTEQSTIIRGINAAVAEAIGDADPKSAEARTVRADLFAKHQAAINAVRERVQSAQAALDELVPRAQRRSFVWLYERR